MVLTIYHTGAEGAGFHTLSIPCRVTLTFPLILFLELSYSCPQPEGAVGLPILTNLGTSVSRPGSLCCLSSHTIVHRANFGLFLMIRCQAVSSLVATTQFSRDCGFVSYGRGWQATYVHGLPCSIICRTGHPASLCQRLFLPI